MRLTAKAIDLPLPKGKLDHIEFDDDIPGFGLRIREGGSRTWVFQYKIGGKQRRMVLGRATAIKAEKARAIAGEYHEQVGRGRDPAGEKAVRKVQAADTLDELVRRYLEVKKDDLRPRSYAEVVRHLDVYAKPLHRLPLTSIDRTIVKDRIDQIAKDSGAVTANRARASLSAMFVWGMTEGLVDKNPVISTRKREEKSRDRVLSDAELKVIWNSVDDDHYGAIIRLLMLTGQRANEIAGLRWSEIDYDRGVILLPGERTKNGRAHQVPMSGTVLGIIEALPRTEERELVFGYGRGPFSGWSKSKEALDAAIGGKIATHWVPHDLRRTWATRMADLGVQPHVIEAVLNHVSGHRAGVAGIYNRAMYAKEKTEALTLWADHIAAVLAGRKSNVTALKRAPAMIPIITPLEAFRLILRGSYSKNPALADQITEIDWFLEAQLSPPFAGTPAAFDVEAAFNAINRLYEHVRHSRVRLRGILEDGPVADIDPSDQAIGDLNVWNLTLDCSTTGQPRIFHNVRCIKDDVVQLVRPSSATKMGRTPHDWNAIETAVHTLMEQRGQFDPDQEDWNCRARLEEVIRDEFGIGRTQLAHHLPAMLDRWMKAGK